MADNAPWVLVRRITAIAALSLWLGGLTFYGAVVVPLGGKVLGSAAAQGFITEEVTIRLNVIGVVAIAALVWNAASADGRRRSLWMTWGVMLVTQVALIALHPYLGELLDVDARRVIDHDAFYSRHRVYLLVTAAQWLAAVIHSVLVIGAWRAADRGVRAR